MNPLDVCELLVLGRNQGIDLFLRKQDYFIQSKDHFVHVELLNDFIGDSVKAFLGNLLSQGFDYLNFLFVRYWAHLNFVIDDASLLNGDSVQKTLGLVFLC